VLELYYAGTFLGFSLLVADLLDLLHADPRRATLWRRAAIALATCVGLLPTAAQLIGYLGLSAPWFPLAYLLGAAIFVSGVLVPEGAAALWLRRGGYLVLLGLATLPSWVLLGFAPAIGLAGIGLVRPFRAVSSA
jgi:hypothetical protein